jgi:hypothetical protein
MNHNETMHRQIERATAGDITPPEKRLTNGRLSTGEYNEALALYLRLRVSLVGI